MVGTLKEVRATAIVGNRVVHFRVGADGRSWRFAGRAGSPGRGTTLRLEVPPEGRRDGGGVIGFFPDGTSTGGRLLLTAGDRARAIRVDWLTGRVVRERR